MNCTLQYTVHYNIGPRTCINTYGTGGINIMRAQLIQYNINTGTVQVPNEQEEEDWNMQVRIRVISLFYYFEISNKNNN